MHRTAFRDGLAWAACAGFLAASLRPLATASIAAGWDLTPHVYLSRLMAELLHEGRVTGYDPRWFAGFPAFTLYPPLFYVATALPVVLSGGAVSVPLAFNLALIAIPFLQLAGWYVAARVFFGPRAGLPALLFGLAALTVSKTCGHAGLGLAGLLFNGLCTQAFALALFLWLLPLLELTRRAGGWLAPAGAGILLGALALSHLITSLFAAAVVLVFGALSRQAWRRWLLTLAVGLAISAWWWIPFLCHLPYSSGQTLVFPEAWADPFYYLFPDLRPTLMRAWLSTPRPSEWLTGPWPALVMLAALLPGLWTLCRARRLELPLLYLGSVLLLTQTRLLQRLELPLHYYRFTPMLFALQALIAARGAVAGLDAICALPSATRRRAGRLAWIGAAFAACGAAVFGAYDLARPLPHWKRPFFEGRAVDYNLPHRFLLRDYPDHAAGMEMVRRVRELAPRGRVAVEINPEDQRRLGSPHFFTTLLPWQADVEVLPGLLAESSLSFAFTQSTMLYGSRTLFWGADFLFRRAPEQTMESMLQRLQSFGVEYLLASSPTYRHTLAAWATSPPRAPGAPRVELAAMAGPYQLYRLSGSRPRCEQTGYRPFLFIELGGLPFRRFAQLWYQRAGLLDRPVLWTPLDYERLSPAERRRLGGLILSYPPGSRVSAGDLGPWWSDALPIVALQAEPQADARALRQVAWLPALDGPGGPEALEQALRHFAPDEPRYEPVTPAVRTGTRLEAEAHGGLLIRQCYFPRWRARQGTLFMATPCFQFVFADGVTVLRYR